MYRVSKKRGIRVDRLVCNWIFMIETIFKNLFTISDSISPILGNNNFISSESLQLELVNFVKINIIFVCI